jgi:proliferating cell nuclear antigen
MKFSMKDHEKIMEFIEIIKFTKNLTQYTTMICDQKGIHIQLLDDSHVSLLNVNIPNEWFDTYLCDEPLTFSISNNILSKLFGLYTKGSIMETEIDDEKYYLSYLNDKENKYFTIVLIDVDKELLTPEEKDTDLDFSIKTELFDHYLNDLSIYGEDVEISYKQNTLYFTSQGDEGEMKIEVFESAFTELNVIDDCDFHCKYAAKYLQYVCKLKKIYKHIHLYLDEKSPLVVKFENQIKFHYFIAPKMNDD